MSKNGMHVNPKTRILRSVGKGAAIVAGCLVVIYGAGCLFFSSHFAPNTSLANEDISFLSADAAKERLNADFDNRVVVVSGEGVTFDISSTAVGLSSNVDTAVDTALASQQFWTWPAALFTSSDELSKVRTSFEVDEARAAVETAVESHNAASRDPIDASIYYDTQSQSFAIDPGRPGTKIDSDSLLETVIRAFGSHEDVAFVTSQDLVPRALTSESESLQRGCDTANSYLGCDLALMVNGAEAARVNADVVQDWLVITNTGVVSLDRERMSRWVDDVCSHINTVGDERTFVRPDGKVCTTSGGSYGWLCDATVLYDIVYDAVINAAVGEVEIPFEQTAEQFNPGGQDWGLCYIDVDLSEQHVRFYGYDGSIIWESDCISGSTGGHETPIGTWFVNAKQTNQVLVGLDENHDGEPDYRTPVNYWMPFEENMVAFHDALWQPGFGGNMNQVGYGSHGCINLPYSATVELFDIVEIGDPVVVHY